MPGTLADGLPRRNPAAPHERHAAAPILRVMIRAGTGVSGAAEAPVAVCEALDTAVAALAGAPVDAALLVATPHHGTKLGSAVRIALERIGDVPLVGATVDGVFRGPFESEDVPGLGLWLLAGVSARSFLVHDVARAGESAASESLHALGRDPTARDLLLLLPDPAGCDLRGLVAGLREAVGAAAVVGCAAADAGDGMARVVAAGETAEGGLAGLWVTSSAPPRVGVTTACRSVAGPYTVTRSTGHWVLGLDDRPALEVYREVAREPLARDLERALCHLLVALPPAPGAAQDPHVPIVRPVSGVSERRGGFALPEPVCRGQKLHFALRDRELARDGLRDLLEDLAQPRPDAGLYFVSSERGERFFGMPGLEAAYLERALPGVPLLGIRAGCEIGTVAGAPSLLTHAGVLALFRD